MHPNVATVNWSGGRAARLAGRVVLTVAALSLVCVLPMKGDTVPSKSKRIIGSTAQIMEAGSGLTFTARVDTGAKTCSIHTEKWEIENPSKRPLQNIGKPIRFQIADGDGDSAWIKALVAGRVRVRSSVQNGGDYHGRYKVRLTLQWEDVKKDVLVTLTDRGDMDYPMLLGRNFLRGDFLVDVEQDSDD